MELISWRNRVSHIECEIRMVHLILQSCREHWEKQFRKKSDVLSLTEIHCCRRIVQLVQATVIAAKHYYQEQQIKRKR